MHRFVLRLEIFQPFRRFQRAESGDVRPFDVEGVAKSNHFDDERFHLFVQLLFQLLSPLLEQLPANAIGVQHQFGPFLSQLRTFFQFFARNGNVVNAIEQRIRRFDRQINRTKEENRRKSSSFGFFSLDFVFHFAQLFEKNQRLVQLFQRGNVVFESQLHLLPIGDDLIEFVLGEFVQQLRVLSFPAEDERAQRIDDRNRFDANATDLNLFREKMKTRLDLHQPFQFVLKVIARGNGRNAFGIDDDRHVLVVLVLLNDLLIFQLRIVAPEKIERSNVIDGALDDARDVRFDVFQPREQRDERRIRLDERR